MMMKRLIACLLAAVMLLGAATAAEEYTLAEKIGLQMEDGSGLKGSMTISATGDADWAKALAAVAPGDYQLRAIRSGEGYVCELYAADGDAKKAVTTLYMEGDTIEMASALLPDMPLTLATDSALLDMLFGASDAGNPTWYGVAEKLLGIDDTEWDAQWEAALAPYYTDIEVWMLQYSAAPEITEDAGGETLLQMRYEIPAKAVGEEILALLQKALQDETLTALLRSQMTDEQAETYLSAERLYHYENVLKVLPLEGSIVMERTVTTMGNDLQSSITVPLLANDDGWQTLTVQDTAGDYVITAASDARTVTLGIATEETKTGRETVITWKDVPAALSVDSMATAWKLNIAKSVETRTDADTRAHDITTWTFALEQDLSHLAADDASRDAYAPVEPISGTVTLHLSSKNSNSSPTTAALDAALTIGSNTLTLSGQVKTASPWVVNTWTALEGEEITAMDEARLTNLWDTFRQNAVDALSAK